MDLRLSPEQDQLRDASRRLLASRLTALVEQLPSPPRQDARQAVRDAVDLGWLGLGIPAEYGGAGGFEDLVLVHEELGRGLAPSIVGSLGLAARVLLHCPPGPRRDELLRGLAAGSVLVAPAPAVDLRVTRTATGWQLDGQVPVVVDADVVTELLLVTAEAVVVTPVPALSLTEQPAASDIRSWSATLTQVVVPEPDRFPTGPAPAATDGAVLAAARAVGAGRAVLERTVDYVRTRHQFDRPIGTFQAVQHQLGDIASALDAAALAVSRAAWSVSSGQSASAAAAGIAALSAAQAFTDATLVAHQLHGGMGFVLDSPLHLWSARAVADPTGLRSRRQQLDALAESLGLSADGLRVPPHHRATPVTS